MISKWLEEGSALKVACATGICAGAVGLLSGVWAGNRLGITVGMGILASSAALLASASMLLPSGKSPQLEDKDTKDEELSKLLNDLHDRSADLPPDVVILDQFCHDTILKAYVPQKGPTCAAASVAGALNVVFGCAESNPFKVSDGMNVYKTIFEGKRDEALEKLKKVLRADPAPLLPVIFSQELCVAARSSDKDKFRFALPLAISEAQNSSKLSNEEEEALAALEAATAADRGPAAALVVDRVRLLARAEWAVSKLHGRWPLPSGKILPSTAPVGNDRVTLCLRAVAMLREGKAVRVTAFMGLRHPCRHIVSKKDTEEDRDRQWEELKRAAELPAAALIFHLHNHYALVFGWRELESTGNIRCKRRQLLTARIGQEPSHWVDWDADFTAFSLTKGKDIVRKSVVSSLLGWAGHKFMLVELPSFASKRAVVDSTLNKFVDMARKRAAQQQGEEEDGNNGVQEFLGEEEDADAADGGSADEPES